MPGFFLIDGVAHAVALVRTVDGFALSGGRKAGAVDGMTIAHSGDSVWIHVAGRTHELIWQDVVTHYAEEAGAAAAADVVRAPMPGAVVTVNVVPGDAVAANDTVMVITSMKMEIGLRAPRAGRVQAIHAEVGGSFERDAVLVTLEPEA